MASVLKLVLSGPLQSYGIDSRWDSRNTNYYPTKSAIIGMIGSAFGYERGDNRLDLLNENLSVNIRIDKPGYILEDSQVVYWDVLSVDGNKRSGHPFLTKYYVQDAIYTVYLYSNKELIDSIYLALRNPVWSLYLGRKSCVPSYPIVSEKPFDNVDDIRNFIINSPIILEERVIKSYLKEKENENKDNNKIWFDIFLENNNGNISLFDSFSSFGYYSYKLRRLVKESFYKEIMYKEDDNCYVFK